MMHVSSILCDPGNLNRALPTLYAVTGLIVPSNVAKVHWTQVLSNSSNGNDIPTIHVVQPGAQTASTTDTTEKKRNAHRTVVAYLGRLDRMKSPSIFVHLAVHLFQHEIDTQQRKTSSRSSRSSSSTQRPYEFWLIGAGELKTTLQDMLHQLLTRLVRHQLVQLDADAAAGMIELLYHRVVFVGARSHEQVLSHLSDDIDIIVHPTLTNETFGLSNVEAMAAGVPVISTCVGGVADYLRHNMAHGICVPGMATTGGATDGTASVNTTTLMRALKNAVQVRFISCLLKILCDYWFNF